MGEIFCVDIENFGGEKITSWQYVQNCYMKFVQLFALMKFFSVLPQIGVFKHVKNLTLHVYCDIINMYIKFIIVLFCFSSLSFVIKSLIEFLNC